MYELTSAAVSEPSLYVIRQFLIEAKRLPEHNQV